MIEARWKPRTFFIVSFSFDTVPLYTSPSMTFTSTSFPENTAVPTSTEASTGCPSRVCPSFPTKRTSLVQADMFLLKNGLGRDHEKDCRPWLSGTFCVGETPNVGPR